MGMVVLELALANLLYCFDWKLPSGMTEMDIAMEEETSPTSSRRSFYNLHLSWRQLYTLCSETCGPYSVPHEHHNILIESSTCLPREPMTPWTQEAILEVHTPRHSSNTREAVHLQGLASGGTVAVPPSFIIRSEGQLVMNPAFLAHKKQDKFPAFWLLSTVTGEVLVHFTAAKTSFDVWTTINRRFGTKSTLKVLSMRHALYSIKKSNLTIKEYLSKVKTLCDNLTAVGCLVTETEQVSVILAGLSVEYESIRVLTFAAAISLNLLTNMLLDYEARQLALLTVVPTQENLASQRQDNTDGSKLPHSQKPKHEQRELGRGWSRGWSHGSGRSWSRSQPQCQLCGKIDHIVHNHGHSSSPPTCSSLAQCCGSIFPSPMCSHQIPSRASTFFTSDQLWYPDFGATNHITPEASNLTTASPYTGTSHVTMGNGESVSIANVGLSNFLAGFRLLRLHTVLHVPTVCKNLMSVGQFAKDDGAAPTKVPLAQQSCFPLLNTAQISSSSLWHNKRGHPCNNTLARAHFPFHDAGFCSPSPTGSTRVLHQKSILPVVVPNVSSSHTAIRPARVSPEVPSYVQSLNSHSPSSSSTDLSAVATAPTTCALRLLQQLFQFALLANHTWKLMPLPEDCRTVGCKWIFKIKRHADGSIARYKGTLVVKGYFQEAGIDFQETFIPVVKPTTIRVVLALAVSLNWPLRQSRSHLLYVLVYVDDIIVTENDSRAIDQFVTQLNKKYIFDLFQRASMDRSNGLPTPMVTTCQLSASKGNPIEDEHRYRSIVRALQYVVITRPDIAYSINKVCKFMHKPLDLYFKAVKRILRYLQRILNYGLRFTRASKFLLEGYSNAIWGSDVDDRRSTSGFCVFLGGNPISWSSRKQQVVSRSTAEAEYRSVAHVTVEMVWIQSLLAELCILVKNKALIWCDSSAVVAVAGNPVMHSKFKHVELDFFFVREKVASGQFQVGHVPGSDQICGHIEKTTVSTVVHKVSQSA
ncbi:hypothetical protein CXB51_004881 [Gossypium anomalum]|uniref:Reverse transcriptase Ty1/copia-type domain-containing protein n=1 Tax=Gossypium anomalum TaxID=47600 RepID=A0A8J5ZM23_9ROSI|nr:hypothetical protein CXB51_004881 [Gossypium anomalum]